MRRLQVLVQVGRLQRVKLTEEANPEEESTVLVLRLLGLVIHDPVPCLVQTGRALGSR